MGSQNTQKADGASVLVIDQACDNDQLLVSLSKNGAKWLSPVGWTDQQKVTLLDCRAVGDTTQIDIPAEFANDITSGDALVLRCSELDIEKEITWERSEIETREAAQAVAAPALGLFSRFKQTKEVPAESLKSETELRAEEADRAAQNFKAKMEAATAAKEDAHRKALEAAREAEAALKMEGERIAEMERAAKAFEEAERLKQDEMRRVDEERRAEEARLAEEARRIEEARKREIAAKKEADRKAALKRYEAALDMTRGEETRLKGRLKDLKKQIKSEAENLAVQQDDLQSRHSLLVTTEETASKQHENFETSALKLEAATADLTILQSKSETLAADRQALSVRLSQADSDYQTAQKEAEAAMARADARRGELDALRQEEAKSSESLSALSEKLTSQSQIVSDASDKSQKLQTKYERSQSALDQEKTEIAALEAALAQQVEKDQGLRLEIEATQQAVEDSQAREASHAAAIEHLRAGGDPENITDEDFAARSLDQKSDSKDIKTSKASSTSVKSGAKQGMMGRMRRSFARDKDAEISVDVKDVALSADDKKAEAALVSGVEETPSFVRRHSSSLMALGAVIGGIAILGGGLSLNKTSTPSLQVKSSTPAPTQVASAVTKVELPSSVALNETESLKTVTTEKVEAELKTDVEAKAETKETKEPVVESAQDAEAVITKTLAKSTNGTGRSSEVEAPVVKMAEIIEPSGFAFELPNMMPDIKAETNSDTAKSKDPAKAASTVKKAEIKDVALEKVTAEKVEPKTSDSVEPAGEAEDEALVNYPELTSDIQERLSQLGFYNGEINGLQTAATQEAIENFKTLFAMDEIDGKITGALLTEIKRAERDQELALEQFQMQADFTAQTAPQPTLQMAEVVPSGEFYDTVQAVPTTSVVTDSLPASQPFQSAPAPQLMPAPVKMASIPTVTKPAPTPVMADVIVDEKIIRNASASYPKVAQRRAYFVDVAIVVVYDIDAAGMVKNLQIESNDHTGRFKTEFEKEALRAVKKLRYEPKTVNGMAVDTTGKQKRIIFRAG